MSFNGIPQDLHYAFQEGSYAFFIVLFLVFLFWGYYLYKKRALHIFSSEENLQKLLIKRPNTIYFLKVGCFVLAWIFAVFAIMQPKGNGYYPEKIATSGNNSANPKLKAHEIIFLIDSSSSMNVEISSNGKTRLDLAKEIADEILSLLNGESAALYAFTSLPTKMSPATLDLFFVRMMLREMQINEGGIEGTDFSKALQTISQNHFKQQQDKLTTLIILSDGGDTSFDFLSDEEQKSKMNAIANEIKDPKALNLRVFTVGLGSNKEELIPKISYQGKPVYSKLERKFLMLLSEKGRGNYYEANELTPIEISKKVIKALQEDNPYLKDDETKDPKELLVYELLFQVPLSLAITLLIFYLFFPNSSIFSSLLLISLLLQTSGFASLNEEMLLAQNYYEAGNLKKSEALYQKMLNEELDPFEKAVILYNQGTLFLNEEQLQSAIETYELIHIKGNPPPHLIYRIKKNLSIAKYRQALKLLSSKDLDDTLLEKVIYLLTGSQKQLESAKIAECELQKIEGRNGCAISYDILKLENAIQLKLDETKKRFKEPFFKESSDEQFMKRIALIDDKAMKLKPENLTQLNDLLKLAIEAQHETLLMTRKFIQDGSKKDITILKNAEEVVLKIATNYFENSYYMQTDAYKKDISLKKPWNEILPLYHKGYEAALEASNLFLDNLEESSKKQEDAIKYWKLKSTLDEKEQKQQDMDQIRQEEQKNATENALLNLQDMQLGDKKQKAYPKTDKQEVERPW